jgi:hypothetical protein
MKEIELTQGKITLVDDEDYEYLNQWKWSTKKHRLTYYATRSEYIGKEGGVSKKRNFLMHRIILNANEGDIIDHINGDGWDNRKENLRFVTNRENCQNKHARKTSAYVGVSWRKREKKWESHVRDKDETIHLGYFKSESDAAAAYGWACEEIKKGNQIKKLGTPKSSKYKYVHYDQSREKWSGHIYRLIDGKRKPIIVGRFDSEQEAYLKVKEKCHELGIHYE